MSDLNQPAAGSNKQQIQSALNALSLSEASILTVVVPTHASTPENVPEEIDLANAEVVFPGEERFSVADLQATLSGEPSLNQFLTGTVIRIQDQAGNEVTDEHAELSFCENAAVDEFVAAQSQAARSFAVEALSEMGYERAQLSDDNLASNTVELFGSFSRVTRRAMRLLGSSKEILLQITPSGNLLINGVSSQSNITPRDYTELLQSESIPLRHRNTALHERSLEFVRTRLLAGKQAIPGFETVGQGHGVIALRNDSDGL